MAAVPALSLIDWPIAPLFACEVLGTSVAVEIGGCAGGLSLPRPNPQAAGGDIRNDAIFPPQQYLESPLARVYPHVPWGVHVAWPTLLTRVRTLLMRMDFESASDDDLAFNINAVHNAFEAWFALVRDWLGVLTRQDLYESEPTSPSMAAGQRFTVWYPYREGEWRHAQGQQNIKARFSRLDTAISLVSWTRAVSAANAGQTAPIEHLLLRDAREALARDKPGRAVLNAGLAGEVALQAAVSAALAQRGSGSRRVRNTLDRLTFGQLVASVQTFMPDLWLPLDVSSLVKARNDAVHAKRAITSAEAREVLATAEALVTRYISLP